MQGEAISLDNEKQATFKISGPGEPLQITMKCNAASARPQRLQTARARGKAVIDALVDKTKPGTVFYSTVYGS
jgi:hypothetical protein